MATATITEHTSICSADMPHSTTTPTSCSPYTVVLDWDSDVDAESLSVHVHAIDPAGAIAAAAADVAAHQRAWAHAAGQAPEDGDTLLDFDGDPTYLQVYAVFPGHLESAEYTWEPGEVRGYTIVLGSSDGADTLVLHQAGRSLKDILDRLDQNSSRPLPPRIAIFHGGHFEVED